MNELIEKAKIINVNLKKNKLIVDYFKFKKIIENSDKLKTLREEKQFYQQNFCLDRNDDNEKKYKKAQKKYDENKIIIQFEDINKEVLDFLFEISFILSKKVL